MQKIVLQAEKAGFAPLILGLTRENRDRFQPRLYREHRTGSRRLIVVAGVADRGPREQVFVRGVARDGQVFLYQSMKPPSGTRGTEVAPPC